MKKLKIKKNKSVKITKKDGTFFTKKSNIPMVVYSPDNKEVSEL